MSLEVEHLSAAFGARIVFRDVGFEARRGRLHLLVGANGAGKTTLLRAVAGLLPYGGSVLWEGKPLAEFSTAARAKILAYLPQGHVAHWPILARDVVAIGRAPAASSLASLTSADRAAIDAALDLADARIFADRPVPELSGGERARIMLARALAVGAPLLLADEPAASLDPAHQLEVMALLLRVAREGRVVLAVMHDLTLAARFADHVLVLDGRRLAASGPPGEVLTPDVLRSVFHVESVEMNAEGRPLFIPWRPIR
jgi:iron complex transport system ATP-binding protein